MGENGWNGKSEDLYKATTMTATSIKAISEISTELADTLNTKNLNHLYVLENVEFGKGIHTIGENAFEYCNRLTYITLPDSIMFIEGGAFWDCGNLKKITLPKNLKTIEYYAFGYCESLTNISIPDSVTTIENNAFDATSISAITLPADNGIVFNSL